MGRDKGSGGKRRRTHSHHSRSHDESDFSDEESSSSDYDLDSSALSSSDSSDSISSSEEERQKRKRKKKARKSSKEEKKKKHNKAKKKEKSREKKTKKKRLVESKDQISLDDYYLRSAEFRTWLSKKRNVFFSDLTSDQSKTLFKKFASKWNSGQLSKSYYKGIQSSDVKHSTQSNYQWKFTSGVPPSDLQTVRGNVSAWSSSKTSLGSAASVTDSSAASTGATTSTGHGDSSAIGPLPASKGPLRIIGPSMGPLRVIGPSMGPSRVGDGEDIYEREETGERERVLMKKERRDFRKQQELVMDELVPKATGGREARLEKKKARTERRREKETSPDIEESSVYGTSANSIRNKVKARQEARQNKAHAALQRISDYKAKEKAKAEAILEMAKSQKKEGSLW